MPNIHINQILQLFLNVSPRCLQLLPITIEASPPISISEPLETAYIVKHVLTCRQVEAMLSFASFIMAIAYTDSLRYLSTNIHTLYRPMQVRWIQGKFPGVKLTYSPLFLLP